MKRHLLFAALLLSQAFPAWAAIEAGSPAPEFVSERLGGSPGGAGRLSMRDLQGKVVYLDFWASWCAPCRASFPRLDALYARLRDRGFEVVAVNKDQEAAEAAKFLATFPVSFPILTDGDNQLAVSYGVKAMPSAYLIDRKGNIRFMHRGFNSDSLASIELQVQQLLGEEQ